MESVLPLDLETLPDEGVLMRRVASGDAEAAGELARSHRDGMYRLAYSLLGDADEAADAAQAGMLRAIGAAGRFDGRGALRNWLLQIVVREAQRIGRRRRWLRLSPGRRDPREPYAGVEAADAVRRGLASLSPPLREAFALLYIEELSIAQAAAVLGIPEGTVKSRAHAARAALRRHLETP